MIDSKEKKSSEKTRQKGNSNLPYFLSHALTASLVGDLQLYEIFDTYRESDYLIVGISESSILKGFAQYIIMRTDRIRS